MKKLSIYLGVIVVLFAAIFIINQQSEKQTDAAYTEKARELYDTEPGALNPDTKKQLDDPNYQNIILPAELDQKLSNQESLFVYYFSPQCIHCQNTTPVLMPMAEQLDVDIRQYNVLEYDQGWDVIEYTPTLIYYQDGQEVDRIVGGIDSEAREIEMEDFLKKWNPS